MANNSLTKARANSYLKIMNSWKKKTMTIYELSQTIGIIEEVIKEHFATFDPMIRMMDDIDILEFKKQLEDYVKVESKVSRPVKKQHIKYTSIGDFVYQNMTSAGGIIDASTRLDLNQLKDLKKLVNEAIKEKK